MRREIFRKMNHMKVQDLRGLKPGWLLYYIFRIYHLNRFRTKKKKKIRNDESYKSCRTPRTEARLGSLLYIWNISFKYFVELRVLIHFF